MKFSDFLTYFTDTIFRRDVTEWRNPVVRWLVQQYRLLFYTARGLLEHGTIVRSAALTFYTLMSLVPILAVVFAVVKGFGLADGLIENLYGLFPRNPDIVDYIVNFAENALARTQGGVVAAVALVMLFWAVIRVFGSIESAFNNIWEVKVERSITRQWTDYIAVVMIVPILWIVANAVGNYAEQLLGFDDSWYFNLLSHLASMIVIWVMFTFLYIVIPNARVRFGSALMAGIVAVNHVALVNRNFSANRTRACQFGNRDVVRAAAQLNRTSIPLHRQQHAPLDVRRAFIDRVNVAEHIDILHLCVGFRSRDFRRNYLAALGRFLKSLNRNFQSNQRLRFQNRVDFRFGGQRNVFCRSNAQHQRHQRRQQCQKPFLHLSHSFLSSIVSFAQNRSGPILFPILILFPP